jgi:poly(3-hydroxybutyrate) depolymerase
LACDLGDHIAAFVSVSATTDSTLAAACPAAKSVSVLFVLGTDDPSVGWDAARVPGRASSLTAEQTMAHWARLNGCSLAPVASQLGIASGSGSAAERWEYPGCRAGNVVMLYVMHGEGHGWPRVVGAPSGTDTVTASGLIVEFFESANRWAR